MEQTSRGPAASVPSRLAGMAFSKLMQRQIFLFSPVGWHRFSQFIQKKEVGVWRAYATARRVRTGRTEASFGKCPAPGGSNADVGLLIVRRNTASLFLSCSLCVPRVSGFRCYSSSPFLFFFLFLPLPTRSLLQNFALRLPISVVHVCSVL